MGKIDLFINIILFFVGILENASMSFLLSRQRDDHQWFDQLFLKKYLRSFKDRIEYSPNHYKCDYHKFFISKATECITRHARAISAADIYYHPFQNRRQVITSRIIRQPEHLWRKSSFRHHVANTAARRDM